MYRTRVAVAAVVAVGLAAAGCRSVTGPAGAQGDAPAASPAASGGSAAVPAGARLVVSTDDGVRLRPAAGPHVAWDAGVTARWSRHGGTWVLDLACPATEPAGRSCPRMPTVLVPAGADVTVSARDAGIDAGGLTGTLDLSTVNGDVTLERTGGAHAALTLATRNGSIRTTGAEAARVGATTVNGDVVLDCGNAPTTVDASTTNGSVALTVPPGSAPYAVHTATGNGHPRVTLPTATGGPRVLTLRTVNGDVTAGT